ncbi:hypothetical protein [Nocardia testacea]
MRATVIVKVLTVYFPAGPSRLRAALYRLPPLSAAGDPAGR